MSKNLHLVESSLGVDIDKIDIVPIVVLSHKIGSGLFIDGVAITDISLLELFSNEGSYASGAAMTKGEKAVTFTTFYNNQEEAEAAIPEVFSFPPPLKPFIEGVEWIKVEFPTAFGKMLLEHPRMKVGALVTPELEAAASTFSLNDGSPDKSLTAD